MKGVSRDQAIVGALVAIMGLGVLWWLYSSVAGMYEFRRQQIAKLRTDVKKLEQSERETQKARETIARHRERSLPADAEIAGSAYQTWLLETLEQAGFGPVQLQAQRPRATPNLATRHSFTLAATEEMPKILEFLNRFYSSGLLHRIEKFTLRPQKDSRKANLLIEIEAMSLRDAEASEKVSDVASGTHRAERFPAMSKSILERNFFGSPNRPPAIDAPSSATVQRGRSADFNWKATDPDPYDRVNLELIDAGETKARLDPSGALRWTPEKNGEYVFKVRATDDGYPQKSVEKTIRVAVVDPPPPPPPDPPKPGYDVAKHAFLVAVLQNGDEGEVWINVRTTGKTLRLRVGDVFDIGQSKGAIESIGERDCVVKIGETRRLFEQGRPLADARVASDASDDR